MTVVLGKWRIYAPLRRSYPFDWLWHIKMNQTHILRTDWNMNDIVISRLQALNIVLHTGSERIAPFRCGELPHGPQSTWVTRHLEHNLLTSANSSAYKLVQLCINALLASPPCSIGIMTLNSLGRADLFRHEDPKPPAQRKQIWRGDSNRGT